MKCFCIFSTLYTSSQLRVKPPLKKRKGLSGWLMLKGVSDKYIAFAVYPKPMWSKWKKNIIKKEKLYTQAHILVSITLDYF